MNSVSIETTTNSVSIKPTANPVAIEATANSVALETFDVWTDYYCLHMAQVTGEHREAGANEPEPDSDPEEG